MTRQRRHGGARVGPPLVLMPPELLFRRRGATTAIMAVRGATTAAVVVEHETRLLGVTNDGRKSRAVAAIKVSHRRRRIGGAVEAGVPVHRARARGSSSGSDAHRLEKRRREGREHPLLLSTRAAAARHNRFQRLTVVLVTVTALLVHIVHERGIVSAAVAASRYTARLCAFIDDRACGGK